jgi:hypothetical protein
MRVAMQLAIIRFTTRDEPAGVWCAQLLDSERSSYGVRNTLWFA